MRYAVTTPPTVEPLSLAEVKAHLRIDHENEDALIRALIQAARETAETHTRRQLCPATITAKLDSFPAKGIIELPRPPLVSVSSITYVDDSDETQTVTVGDCQTDTTSEPGRLAPEAGETWPNDCNTEMIHPVTIIYSAGYANTDAIPQGIKQGMFLLIGLWYENREAATVVDLKTIPFAVETLFAINSIAEVF